MRFFYDVEIIYFVSKIYYTFFNAACAAANLAIGTLNGEQLT